MPTMLRARPAVAPIRAGAFPAVRFPFLQDPLRVFRVALVISLALHAVVLSIHFRLPEMALARMRDPQLEIVLVNAKSASRPAEPQARAQANLDGGGNVDEKRRAKTPLPSIPQRQTGTELMQAEQRPREQEAPQPKLLSAVPSPVTAAPESSAEGRQERSEPSSGVDLAQNALAMARLEAQIARNLDQYNKRPRKKFVGARTVEAAEAQYVEDWRQKVERVGNLNYPDSARGKVYGHLVMSVGIRSDGQIDTIEINRPSGQKILDEAALRIVKLAGPYGPFPPSLRRDVDILVITRTWSFTQADRLQSD